LRLGICGGTKIKQLKKYLVVVLGIAMLMVVAMCASTLYQSYRQTRLSAVANAGNVTLISQRAISRNLEVLSLALDTLAYRYQHPISGRRLDDAQRYAYLFGSAASVSHISVMAVHRPQGWYWPVRAGVREPAPNYGDRAYFTAHRDSANVGCTCRGRSRPTWAMSCGWWCCPSACSMTMAALAASS
jgi:type II secretory pathway pseudopilin PulG